MFLVQILKLKLEGLIFCTLTFLCVCALNFEMNKLYICLIKGFVYTFANYFIITTGKRFQID